MSTIIDKCIDKLQEGLFSAIECERLKWNRRETERQLRYIRQNYDFCRGFDEKEPERAKFCRARWGQRRDRLKEVLDKMNEKIKVKCKKSD